MSENIKAFLELVSKDKEKIERLKTLTEEEQIISMAAELGIELTAEDFGLPEGEMDDRELQGVSGGATGGCFCALGGGGGGTQSDGDIYGCACVAYGQGGDGEKDDFTCFCALAGEGVIDVLPDEMI